MKAITPTTPLTGALDARTASNPPRWLLIALGALYLTALGIFVFLPGGTLIERLRALDSGICAQLPTHSFYPGGERLPLCARNTGIYLGFAIGVIALFARGLGRSAIMPRFRVALALIAGIALMGIDGFNSLFLDIGLPHLYQPNNLLRLFTGLLTGTAMAAFLLPVVNGILWRAYDRRPAYNSFHFLAPLAPFLALAFLAAVVQWGWLLYPLTLLSSVGMLTALSLINLTFVLAFTGRVERYVSYLQVVPIFTVAFGCAILELVGLFFLKQSFLGALGG